FARRAAVVRLAFFGSFRFEIDVIVGVFQLLQAKRVRGECSAICQAKRQPKFPIDCNCRASLVNSAAHPSAPVCLAALLLEHFVWLRRSVCPLLHCLPEMCAFIYRATATAAILIASQSLSSCRLHRIGL